MDMKTEDIEFARRELENTALLRETARMVAAKMSVEDIADGLDTTFEKAKKLVARASFLMKYDGLPLTPREIIYRAAVGDLTRGAMLDALVRISYTYAEYAEPENPLSVLTVGSWDDLMMCYYHGLISLSEISTIADLREELRKAGLL